MSEASKAYHDRNIAIVALAKAAIALERKAWLWKHDIENPEDAAAKDPEGYREFMTVVFVDLPTGQVSWSIHDNDVALFHFLPLHRVESWDGHTTEEKQWRIMAWLGDNPVSHCGERGRL